MKDFYVIDVNSEDISEGCKYDGNNCMVARAVLRCVPEATKVYASYVGIVLTDKAAHGFAELTIQNEYIGRYTIPKEVAQVMNDFDKGKPVEPFGFVMTLEK